MWIITVPVSQDTIKGKFKIILNYGTMIRILKLFPHHAKVTHLSFKLILNPLKAVFHVREEGNVPAGCMNIDEIRVELNQLLIIKHGILPVLCILRLIKLRFNSVV